MDEEQGFPLRLPDLFLHHVLPDALEHLSGVRRRTGSQTGGNASLDVQAAVALGLSRNAAASGHCTIRFRFLQRNADFHCAGADHHGSVQAPQLVCLLSDGHYDTADLQSKKRKMIPRRDFNEKNDTDI